MNNSELLQKIRAYTEGQNFSVVGAVALAPGIIAVSDSMDEIDIYFDTGIWELVHATRISMGEHGREVAEGLGCLPGISTFLRILTYASALSFAQLVLTPRWASEFHSIWGQSED